MRNTWQIRNLEIRRRTLDFSSSGQGKHKDIELLADGVQIVNAVNLLEVDGSQQSVQVQVCKACGVVGCETGGWVVVRKIGNKVVFAPSVEEMREGDWERHEYRPPRYVSEKGIPVFSIAQYEKLLELASRFPGLDAVPEASSREILGLIQFTAPGNVLGTIGYSPTLDSENIVAVTEGDLDEEVESFSRLIRDVEDGALNRHSVSLGSVGEFHLDIPGFPSWKPFGYVAGVAVLYANLDPEIRSS